MVGSGNHEDFYNSLSRDNGCFLRECCSLFFTGWFYMSGLGGWSGELGYPGGGYVL